MNPYHEIAYRLDPALWMRNELEITPHAWQEEFLRAERGASIAVLTARQVGKTTIAAAAMAHTAVFMPGSLSVVACPTQQQSAEALRKVREMLLKVGAELKTDNVYRLELTNGSRVLALPGTHESIRGLTVDGWIVADEAAQLDPAIMGALHPMRTQCPSARFAIMSTAWSRTDPFWSVWDSDDPSWTRIDATLGAAPNLIAPEVIERARRQLSQDDFKREYLGIPAGGIVSPFTWELFEQATHAAVVPPSWDIFKPTIIAHDVGHTKGRSTAVVGGRCMLAPDLSFLKEFEELPQGLLGSARAEPIARLDRLYDYKTLIFVDLSYDPTYAEILAERIGPERVIGLKITGSGDGMKCDFLRVKNGAIRLYTVGRTHLFDLLHRELHENKVWISDSEASRRAYHQLMTLEVEYRQGGTTIYKPPPSGRHDDLAISCAILVWAAQHPHLEVWCRVLEPRSRTKQTAISAGAWT